MMRVAIVHYHLQTGGVTRVIQHACRALAAGGHKVVVLTGQPPQQPVGPAAVHVLAALGYEETRRPSGAAELAQMLDTAARDALGAAPDIWHIHNHCLGKNLALPGALLRLAGAGAHLLLQPHDFAEDGRPALYRRMVEHLIHHDGAELATLLYPLAPQIHYALLNGRDHGFLAAAGVPAERLHLLPNAVSIESATSAPAPDGPASGDGRRLWLYPTRAIRRKNIGELLLWAALAPERDRFGTTQAPQNPVEQPRYRRWVELAAELALPVEFELGRRSRDFHALLASTEALVTTSVGEGFGLAFLEPWLIGRPLVGRDLPEITADFSREGIDLSMLYRRIPIPLDWIDPAALRQRMQAALHISAQAYGLDLPAEHLERAWGAAVESGTIDFGRLDEPAQELVLRRSVSDPSSRRALIQAGPRLCPDEVPLAPNRAVIERAFLVDGYRARLEAIYHSLSAEQPTPTLDCADGAVLLAKFQAPERLFLLRT